MSDLTVAISEGFLESFAKIPRNQQRKVMEFVTKFRYDPQRSGINYEKIANAKDPNFRSVRVDQDYRGIILKPETGNVYVLLWVANHDDAYDWAQRHQCKIHPETGSLQLMETTDVTPEPPAKEDTSLPSLFSLRDRELLRLGVPEALISRIKTLTSEKKFHQIQNELPKEAFEALCFLSGDNPLPLDEVMAEYDITTAESVDTNDFETALLQPNSQRSFYVVGDDELTEMLEAPLEKWRIFLHPSQRKLVDRDWNGPLRVLGGAGTGKTVVAMHRAKWLAKQLPKHSEEKILFTTFTANLALDIQDQLKKICDRDLFDKIEVVHFDRWMSQFLKRNEYPHQIVYDSDDKYQSCWKKALSCTPPELDDFHDTFYREEWLRVILPQRITTKAEYFGAKRSGRGIALTRKQRALIWPVFEEMRIQLHQQGLRTSEDATLDSIDILNNRQHTLPYQAVVVDEAQDMGYPVLSLIRKLVPEQKNDIFIVGDGHQRIYRHKTTLSHCGINIRGRSRKLKINYRTTEETRRFAMAVLEGITVDDLDGGEDKNNDYRSLLHGNVPSVQGFDSVEDEVAAVLEFIKEWCVDDITTKDFCVIARTQQLLDVYGKTLKHHDKRVYKITRKNSDNRQEEGIRLATMHRVKGLEFKFILMLGVNEGKIPLRIGMDNTDDPMEIKALDFNERALFHVSATRAINGLWISYCGKPSEFID